MRNTGLEQAQAGIKIAGRNINDFRYTDDTTLMADRRGTKEPLDESQRGEWKNWLKTQHSKNEDHVIQSNSVQFSHSVVSDSLRPHESQHARPPCPSPTPGVHSNSHPSSR